MIDVSIDLVIMGVMGRRFDLHIEGQKHYRFATFADQFLNMHKSLNIDAATLAQT